MSTLSNVAVPDALRDFFARHSRIALAFSGGTDSAYLMYAARASGATTRAYYVHAQFQPAFELRDAERLAGELDTPMTVLPRDVLAVPEIAANPPDRCYLCKQVIFRGILEAAATDGFTELMDGTNASDDAGDRPGMRALRELSVLSPLRLCGVTKAEVRELSRQAGLFTWDKPAYACLATRIPTGTPIRAEDLRRVERAEEALKALGFTDFRVRLMDGCARLQVPEAQFLRAAEEADAIRAALGADFNAILLDFKTR